MHAEEPPSGSFADALYEWMVRSGHTQASLTEELGISAATLEAWLHEHRLPTAAQAAAVDAAFKLKPGTAASYVPGSPAASGAQQAEPS